MIKGNRTVNVETVNLRSRHNCNSPTEPQQTQTPHAFRRSSTKIDTNRQDRSITPGNIEWSTTISVLTLATL